MTLPLGLGGPTAAVQRAIELVIAVEGSTDRATRYESVVAVLARWADGPDAALGQQFEEFVAAVVRLAAIFDERDPDRAVAGINALLAAVAVPPRLEREPGWGWHVHVDPADAEWATWLLASSAIGMAVLISEHELLPWGRCDDDDCRRPFLDRGRRTAQRYCSATCSTRSRVRRHRARSARRPKST